MNLEDPVAALEIGTSRTVLMVGEPQSADSIRVCAMAEIPSAGVRQGQITDVTQAGYSIASVLKRIEKEYRVSEAALVVSGPQITSQRVTTTWQIDAKTRKVTEEDVTSIYNNSLRADADAASCVLLDAQEQSYALDDIESIDNPVGLTGDLLKLNTLLVRGPKARIDDQRSAAEHAKLAVGNTFFAGSCAADAVLRTADRAAGALVVDLGGGCTPFTVWTGGKLVLAGVVPVGGDHATNDVRVAFGTSTSQAEELKKRASAILSKDRATGRIELAKSITATGPDSVSKRALDVVVNARFAELFAIVREKLDDANLLHRIGAGVFLVGGGAQLAHVAELAETVLGLPARVPALVPEIEGLEKKEFPAAYATVAGLMLRALKSEDGPDLMDTVRKLWKKVTSK